MNDLSRTFDVKKLLNSTHTSSPRARARLLSALLVAAVLSALAATPAFATGSGTSTLVNSPIKAGKKATTVGSGSFTRTRYESGQKLKVNLFVEQGITESHICVSDEPFTQRVPPGSCPSSNSTPNQTHTYTIDLGAADGPIYVQAHTATAEGETAYAGWQSGNPFYGNLEIADPGGDGTPVPIGAVGALLLSGVVAGGLVLRGTRR